LQKYNNKNFNLLKIAFETHERHTSIEDHYLIFTDNYGGDRSLDTADGNPFWQTLYLDGLQILYNYDVSYRNIYLLN
jgi:hypothetical protein